jgi:hypothetical protein
LISDVHGVLTGHQVLDAGSVAAWPGIRPLYWWSAFHPGADCVCGGWADVDPLMEKRLTNTLARRTILAVRPYRLRWAVRLKPEECAICRDQANFAGG